jgi:hypothetical protein
MGNAPFSVTTGAITNVLVELDCHQAARTGSVLFNGTVNVCPVVDSIAANPTGALVGGTISLSATVHDLDTAPGPLTYIWSATSGSLSSATAAAPTFTCTGVGPATITLTLSDGDCPNSSSAIVTCN